MTEETEQEKNARFRDQVGQRVHQIWIDWAEKETPNAVPSDWDTLSDIKKDLCRRIGCAVWGDCVNQHSSAISAYMMAQFTRVMPPEAPASLIVPPGP